MSTQNELSQEKLSATFDHSTNDSSSHSLDEAHHSQELTSEQLSTISGGETDPPKHRWDRIEELDNE
jgi:hypothetical protein